MQGGLGGFCRNPPNCCCCVIGSHLDCPLGFLDLPDQFAPALRSHIHLIRRFASFLHVILQFCSLSPCREAQVIVSHRNRCSVNVDIQSIGRLIIIRFQWKNTCILPNQNGLILGCAGAPFRYALQVHISRLFAKRPTLRTKI